MPTFGAESKKQLATCHPELQLLFNEVIKYYDCKVLEGYRNQADQEKAFNAGNSKLHYPNGKHNRLPSIAVDVSPFPVNWNDTKRFYWFAGFVLGMAVQLKAQGKMHYDVRYGGDWNMNKDINDQTFNDLVHFELVM
jgi:peptidoglycan LD-endopeptidase CwlK